MFLLYGNEHQYWSRLLQVGQLIQEHFALRWRLFLFFFIVSRPCCSCCHVEEGGTVLEHLKLYFFFPCLGSFCEWPPKLDSVKRQQCKLCSVEGRKKESEVAQLYPTLCHSLDCSLPVSSIHGIFQARILEWITISFSRGYSQWEHRLLRLADLVKMYFVCQLLSATPDICVNIVSCMSGSVWISTYPHII